MSKRKRWAGRIYLGRDENGKQLFHWIGRFDTRRERDEAVAEARVALKRGGDPALPTCDEYVDRYLADFERRVAAGLVKDSSLHVQSERLRRFRQDFAGRSLDVSRAELKDWVNGEGKWRERGPVGAGQITAVVSLYNHAIDEDDLPLGRSPARKLSHRSKGRAEEPPPSEEEFRALVEGCSALGDYMPKMRALLLFAAYTLMRPGELYPLEWTDIDFDAMRIGKRRRLYRGRLAEPKTGPKVIALTRPARDAVIGLPRDNALVFTSKTGKRLAQSTLSVYWSQVKARAGLDFDFYHATKHYGVHYMWTKLGMSPRAIAAQAGWGLRTVEEMLSVYGHGDVGALEEVDAAFATTEATPLRAVE
ncbi:MAG TPA: tyrosine-type recombinase/integrase [Solirubrobacterales bacterium]|nr:tyrosine-type recombinase/integrase [Solirubrobacterales bacterium]